MSLAGPAKVQKAWFTDDLRLQDLRVELEGGIIIDIAVVDRKEVLEPEVAVVVEIYGPRRGDSDGDDGLRNGVL